MGNEITITLCEYNRLTDIASRSDKLAETNGWLCGEVNRLTEENSKLRKLAHDAWATTDDCKADRCEECEYFIDDFGWLNCGIEKRMHDLEIEVSE